MEREYLNPAGVWDTAGRSYSHVVKISSPNRLIFLAGQAPVDENFGMRIEIDAIAAV